jgi:hypothetical protein
MNKYNFLPGISFNLGWLNLPSRGHDEGINNIAKMLLDGALRHIIFTYETA